MDRRTGQRACEPSRAVPRHIGWPVGVACGVRVLAIGLSSWGCAKPPQLMPTPNVYARGDVDPFLDAPPELQNDRAEVLYVTDRAMEPSATVSARKYGYGRSRSVAFGISQVQSRRTSLGTNRCKPAARGTDWQSCTGDIGIGRGGRQPVIG